MSENNRPDLRFLGNVVIRFYVVCKSGLHIGGGDEGYEIGGMENTVIKDPMSGHPYIPGSTLKGKIRSLLEWAQGLNLKQKKGQWEAGPCACGKCDICAVFGTSADTGTAALGPTRVIFKDSHPTADTVRDWEQKLGHGVYTEVKFENTLDRLTSAANPRQMERVPAGSEFDSECVFRVLCQDDIARLQTLLRGMGMLADNFLGGSGSRGSGAIALEGFDIEWHGSRYYQGQGPILFCEQPIATIAELVQGFDNIAGWLKTQLGS